MINSTSVIIAGISSDIGLALSNDWISKGWKVSGTYRRKSKNLSELENALEIIVPCDFSNPKNIDSAIIEIISTNEFWDVLVMAPGLQDPVGLFSECDIDEWSNSIQVNFVNQIRFLRKLLKIRNLKNRKPPCVIFFAGGGTNNAPTHYSAYIASKIALIKMTEILSVEIPDTKFVILGPGWVKTKIHESTLKVKEKAGKNYQKTVEMFSNGEWNTMESVVKCCNWLINSDKDLTSGRNFSLKFDKWGSNELEKNLKENTDLYKLRRFGN